MEGGVVLIKNLSGMVFGRLTVVDYFGEYKWNCICTCGEKKIVRTGDLVNGKTKSCGCLKKEILSEKNTIDLTGKRFGNLTVIEKSNNDKSDGALWKCRCDCGKEITTRSTYLLSGDTKSCGCRKTQSLLDRNVKHGHANNERLYNIWKGMRSRCNNPNSYAYNNYGGRGVKICEEWNDYEKFRIWALSSGFRENKSGLICSIDRIDTNGNYCPENCRWVDIKTQCRNRRSNRLLEVDGEVKSIVEWSEEYGVPAKYIKARIDKLNWSAEDAVKTQVLQVGGKFNGNRRASKKS